MGMKGPERNPEFTRRCSEKLLIVDSSIHPKKAVAVKYRNHVKKLSYSIAISSKGIPFETWLYLPIENKIAKSSDKDNYLYLVIQYISLVGGSGLDRWISLERTSLFGRAIGLEGICGLEF